MSGEVTRTEWRVVYRDGSADEYASEGYVNEQAAREVADTYGCRLESRTVTTSTWEAVDG